MWKGWPTQGVLTKVISVLQSLKWRISWSSWKRQLLILVYMLVNDQNKVWFDYSGKLAMAPAHKTHLKDGILLQFVWQGPFIPFLSAFFYILEEMAFCGDTSIYHKKKKSFGMSHKNGVCNSCNLNGFQNWVETNPWRKWLLIIVAQLEIPG